MVTEFRQHVLPEGSSSTVPIQTSASSVTQTEIHFCQEFSSPPQSSFLPKNTEKSQRTQWFAYFKSLCSHLVLKFWCPEEPPEGPSLEILIP